MRKRITFKTFGKFLLDFFEIYLPSVAFSVMFLMFILQIFFRYFLNHPLIWPYELTIFGFIWTAILGACFARRHGVHVVFGLIYDHATPKIQWVLRFLSNGLIAAAFLIALKPSYEYVQFMAFQKSTVLRVPFHMIFFPYIIFLVLILGHTVYDLVIDVRKLARGELS